MAAWCFKTAARYTRSSSSYQWYWQIDTARPLALTSTRLFPTLEACVADAKQTGFRGDVDTTEAPAYPAVLTYDQGDYVEGIVQRSLSQRFEGLAAA